MSTVDVPAAHSSALGASVAKKALNRDVVDPSPEQGEVSVFSNGEFQGTAAEIREKYNQERNKRERLDGNGQYIPAMSTAKYAHFSGDPWNPAQPNVNGTWSSLLEADAHVKYLIVGAGFGGLLMAIHLVQAGISVKDIRIVDRAHGFGGTWYWSRFPGIACDTESYIYLPLLEETGYVPKTKYATGNEIRLYADLLADKWNLRDRALFGANITSVVWDAKASKWTSTMTQEDVSVNTTERKIRSDFVFLTTGLFDHPKLPRIKGLEDFRGSSFHTSRWDYSITGGSPSDPSLSLLKDKRVGVIGTGATAVQAVPHLAKWSKELFVFQRTPASVDIRNNRATDPVEWSDKIAATKGWQRERRANFDACMCPGISSHTGVDLVSDAFSHLNASAQLGSPFQVTNDNIGEYLDKIHTIDMPRQARLRARVTEIVKDKKTAESLTNWYPSWCKRPGVHDDYLQSFNLPTVHLVDTDGKGVDRITETGVVAGGGDEIPLDVLVFSTGYGLVVGGGRDAIFSFDTVGRAGRSLENKFLEGGTSTLHGVMSHDFPNLFWLGPWQSGVSANYTTTLDNLTRHIAFIVSQAIKKGGENCLIETTVEAEEAWTGRVLQSALAFAGMAGCTPNYMNREGDMDRISKPADQLKAAKGALWGLGIGDYVRTIKDWEVDGRLEGLEVTSIA